jgi:DNA polymerase III subunit gamma/tau
MSYTVLALKWRPKGFDEVVGQPHIVANLKSAIEKNKVAHAYIFSGPRGVGKTSCARILAKALNCAKGPAPEPCGSCPSCLDITAGRSLDVMEIDGASNRGIDEIRTLRENVKFAPASGRNKVYIIDEVHQITADGFNALLKTLEEPPEFVKFILATTAPQKVPSTILSRCQRMDFRRISVMEIIGQLEKIIAAEGGAVDRDVLFAIARASDGALRDAESILDQLLAFAKDKLSVDDVVAMLGNVQLETLFQVSEACREKDSRRMLALINDIIDKGKDAAVLLQDLIGHFRNLMVARVAGADTQLIDLPKELCDRLVSQSAGFSLEELFAAFNILVETQEMARRMESVRIPLEINLVRLCSPRGTHSVSGQPGVQFQKGTHPASSQAGVQFQKGTHPASSQAGVQPRPAQKPASPVAAAKPVVPPAKPVIAQSKTEFKPAVKPVDPPPVSDSAPVAVLLEDVKNGLEDVITAVAKSRMSVATYLREGMPEKVESNCISIAFPNGLQFHKEFLEKKENKSLLERCFSEKFGSGLRVSFILSDMAEKAKSEAAKDATVRTAIDTFNGRLL